MRTWITSDLHFGHTNIMKFCPGTRSRFKDVDDMNETMIREWNQIVSDGDLVYILGDFAFLPADKAVKVANRLNGDKILVEGNHDRKLLNDPVFRRCFKEVHQYLSITYDKHRIIMSHFPFLEWDQMHRGSLHFYGHLHGGQTNQEHYRCLDVGFDSTGFLVLPMERAISAIVNNEIKRHH